MILIWLSILTRAAFDRWDRYASAVSSAHEPGAASLATAALADPFSSAFDPSMPLEPNMALDPFSSAFDHLSIASRTSSRAGSRLLAGEELGGAHDGAGFGTGCGVGFGNGLDGSFMDGFKDGHAANGLDGNFGAHDDAGFGGERGLMEEMGAHDGALRNSLGGLECGVGAGADSLETS